MLNVKHRTSRQHLDATTEPVPENEEVGNGEEIPIQEIKSKTYQPLRNFETQLQQRAEANLGISASSSRRRLSARISGGKIQIAEEGHGKARSLALKHKRVDDQDQDAEIEVTEIEQEEESGQHDQRPKGAHFPIALGLSGWYCNEKRANFLFHFEGRRGSEDAARGRGGGASTRALQERGERSCDAFVVSGERLYKGCTEGRLGG